MSQKTNPKKVPKTQADVDKARKLGQAQGVDLSMTIFFTALLDKAIIEPEEVKQVWDACLYVSDSIVKGYVNVYEQQKILKEEYGVTFDKIIV